MSNGGTEALRDQLETAAGSAAGPDPSPHPPQTSCSLWSGPQHGTGAGLPESHSQSAQVAGTLAPSLPNCAFLMDDCRQSS